MIKQDNSNKNELMNFIETKVMNIQSPIATIEICVYLLSNGDKSDHLSNIRKALQQLRGISRQLLDYRG